MVASCCKKSLAAMARHSKSAFTLVEVMIVVTIIAFIATITLAVFTIVQRQSRDSTRATNTRQLMNALDRYWRDNGEYPNVCPGGDNAGCAVSLLSPALVPKYIASIPADPSGQAFSYVRGIFPNKSYGILISYESKTPCKTGIDFAGNFTYNGAANTWWGPVSSVPICADPKPDSN